MQNLEMNINVAKASAILGMVSSHTGVDTYLLLDDDAFGALLTEKAHTAPVARAVVELTAWVNNNY
jgi:hypothetical protein